MQSGNIFSDIPKDLDQEAFEEIINSGNFRIERIMSRGHSTPPGQWYDQDQDEWVIVLAGSAALLFGGLRPRHDIKSRRLRQHPGTCEAQGGMDQPGRRDYMAGCTLRLINNLKLAWADPNSQRRLT